DPGRHPARSQGPRVPGSHHAVRGAGAGGLRPQRLDREGGGGRLLDHRRRVRRRRSHHRRLARRRLGRGRARPEGQGADRLGVRPPAPRPGPVHLPAPGGLARVHRRAAERRHDGRGVRDGAAARPLSAPARPDVRGRRTDGAAGRSPLPGARGGRARCAARRGVRCLRRQGRRARRGGVGAQRGGHRPRDAGRGPAARQERRPAAGGRPHLPGPHADRHQQHLRGRAGRARRRSRDRGGARPRRQGAHPHHRRPGRGHEARRGARRHLRRPGRVLRVDASDHPLRPRLRGQRLPVLLRRQHARRGAQHLHLRPHQRHAAVRRRDREPGRTGGRAGRSGPRAGRQHRRRAAGLRAGRRGARPARRAAVRGAGL
ncbi:MAG: Alanine dehydrogenase, partial [uncultured Frankineae bacterium]